MTPIIGVIIGWVPDASVARVTVAGAGYRGSATVVAQHFILSLPATARAGLPLTVTGLAAAGTAPGTWSVALDDGN